MSIETKADILYSVTASIWKRAEKAYNLGLYDLGDEITEYFDIIIAMT